jgi:uncharacterized protein (TIGR03437 family)
MRTLAGLVLFFVTSADPAGAYVRMKAGSNPAAWPYGQQIQYQIDSSMRAGITNESGEFNIVPGSDAFAAVQAALDTWNAVPGSAARFSPLLEAASGTVGRLDGANVVGFAQTKSTLSVVGGALAVTAVYYNVVTGEMVDADIIVNPAYSYSTKLARGAFDIQSTITHELGHSLGAAHSPLRSAAMYAYAAPETTRARTLSPDDASFVVDAYPATFKDPEIGHVSGQIACPSETCRPAPSVMLFDASHNMLLQTTADTAGNYNFRRVAPGSYYLFVDPYLPDYRSIEDIDPAWSPAIYGGAQSPQVIDVTAGSDITASLAVQPVTLLVDQFIAGDSYVGATLHSGYPGSLAIFAKGDLGDFKESDVLVLGSGVALQPDSLDVYSDGGYSYVGCTLDVPSVTTQSTAVVAVRQGDSIIFAPGISILPDGPAVTPSSVLNAASFESGPIAPGEMLAIGGYRLGPAEGVNFEDARSAGVNVSIGGFDAPVLYADDTVLRVQVPYELSGSASAAITVHKGDAVAEDVLTAVAAAAPGLMHAAFNEDGTPNSDMTPAARGSVVSLYGTGQGPVDPPLASGQKASPETPSTIPRLQAYIDGTAADIKAAYMVPGAIGIFRVDVVVPRSVASGSANVKLSIGKMETMMSDAVVIR